MKKYFLLILLFASPGTLAAGELDKQFLEILRNEDVPSLETLCTAGFDVNAMNSESGYHYPLELAVESGSELITRALIGAGADVNLPQKARSPLMLAAQTGSVPILKMLIEAGANANFRDLNGGSALTEAVLTNKPSAVRYLHSLGMRLNPGQYPRDGAAFLNAANYGYLEIMQILLENGVDVNFTTLMQETALMSAAKSAFPESVRFLLKQGAGVNIRDIQGCSALMRAAANRTKGNADNEILTALLKVDDLDIHLSDKRGRTALFYAIEAGNPAAVKLLLAAGAEAVKPDNTGISPLELAVTRRNVAITGLLLAAGIPSDPDSYPGLLLRAIESGQAQILHALITAGLKPEPGVKLIRGTAEWETPVTAAAKKGNQQMVELMLDAGYGVNRKNSTGWTPLLCAVDRGSPELVSVLLDAGADREFRDSEGKTALVYAVDTVLDRPFEDAWSVITLLLEAGADPGQKIGHGRYLLIDVVRSNGYLGNASNKTKLRLIKLLIAAGADVNQRDYNGESALYASYKDCTQCREITIALLKAGSKAPIEPALLHWFARQDDFEVVRLLIAAGVDLSVREKTGWSALDIAISKNNLEMARYILTHSPDKKYDPENLRWFAQRKDLESVRLLVEAGVDVNAQDMITRSPLIIAVKNKDEKMVDLLLAAGADVNPVRHELQLPFCLTAVEETTLSILKKLIKAGLEFKGCNSFGDTAIHFAALRYRDSAEVTSLLLQKGFAVNALNFDQQTPLMIAARYGQSEMAEVLLAAGASPDLQDKEQGKTALMYASEKGREQIVEMLLTAGADLKLTDNNGQTALDYALHAKQDAVAALLTRARARAAAP